MQIKYRVVGVATAAVLLAGLAQVAQATVIVAPNGMAAAEGNSDNGYPFNIADHDLISLRYQQVFAASEFGALSGPQFLTQIAFRPDEVWGDAFAAGLPSVQINFSTTAAGPDAMSTTFADNVGADDTVTFAGPLVLTSNDLGGPPRVFDIVISLATPFVYDPSLGNLLMDVRNFGGGFSTQFDSTGVLSDGTSRVYSLEDDGVGSPTGFDSTDGLVAQFTFEPVPSEVPEPGTLLLLGGGITGLVMRRRRRSS